MSSLRSWVYLVGCNLMWSLQFTCIKLVQDQVGPLFTVWGPMTLATIMLWCILRKDKKRGQLPPRSKNDILIFFLLALLGVFPGQVIITWGTRVTLASNAALLMLTLPVSTAILAVIFLGERMTPLRWFSFGVAIVGMLMCSGIDFRSLDLSASFLLGNALVLLGTLGGAFYNSYSKKVLERYSPMETLFYSYVAMFVIMTPLVIVKERSVLSQIPAFTLRTWVGLALLTVLHNFLAMVLFLKALDALDAIQAALSNYLITFFGVPIAALWLGERLKFTAISGGALILISTLLITLWEKRQATA